MMNEAAQSLLCYVVHPIKSRSAENDVRRLLGLIDTLPGLIDS